jgi:oxygen-independent coproporphyrinogen-3 oxidase
LHYDYKKSAVTLPDEELILKMDLLINRQLPRMGYARYEVSNYAKKGFESAHNLKYWNRDEYVGFGCSAASLLGNRRITNESRIYDWNPANREYEEIGTMDAIRETLFLRMRLTEGVCLEILERIPDPAVKKEYCDKIDRFVREGLMIKNNGIIRLSAKGFRLGNVVWSSLY